MCNWRIICWGLFVGILVMRRVAKPLSLNRVVEWDLVSLWNDALAIQLHRAALQGHEDVQLVALQDGVQGLLVLQLPHSLLHEILAIGHFTGALSKTLCTTVGCCASQLK